MALTDEQKAIVEAGVKDRILVLAGPGTGKTEVLARRLIHLLNAGIRPSQTLVLSFSRNAVRNVTDRIRTLSSVDEVTLLELRHLVVRTFDSWSFRVLRQIGESAGQLLEGSYEGNISKLVAYLRADQRDLVRDRLSHIRHIIVDELQDLAGWRGELVVELLELICPKGDAGVGFTLLGDPAQSIYGFSLKLNRKNASVFTAQDLLRDVREIYAEELQERCLVGNFRSTAEIARTVGQARSILLGSESGEQKLRKLAQIVNSTSSTDLGQLMSGQAVGGGDGKLAILCETNGQALVVANELYGRAESAPQLPIVISAGSPAKSVPAWVGATLGRFSADVLTRSNFSNIYKQLYSGPAAKKTDYRIPELNDAWEMLKTAAPSEQGKESVSIGTLRQRLQWPDVLPDDEGVLRSSIEITTVHQSKGLEYDRVKLVWGARDEKSSGGDKDEGGLLEEANVLFVALSRASGSFERIEGIENRKIYKATFGHDERTRWCNWWGVGRGCQVEIGLPGDISNLSFVSKSSFPSQEEALESQEWLARNAESIRGRKVVLVKKLAEGSDNQFIYSIHLQEAEMPARFLGITQSQLTYDLLSVFNMYGKGTRITLPARIFNLRVADVISMSGVGEQLSRLHKPWGRSGLWSGVRVHGLGYFKPKKRY
jgi:DNA helicase II / ATP-dependent DNA helicase PcrA